MSPGALRLHGALTSLRARCFPRLQLLRQGAPCRELLHHARSYVPWSCSHRLRRVDTMCFRQSMRVAHDPARVFQKGWCHTLAALRQSQWTQMLREIAVSPC